MLRNSRFARVWIMALSGVAVLTLGSCGSAKPSSRQEQVAANGAKVMPFDLTRTTHIFSKTADGGVQTVTANDPKDSAQVELIRGHLRKEGDRFRNGDFSDPTKIHGMDMPGVSALASGASSITVTYRDLPDGAELAYVSSAGPLVDALHMWFDAQTSDHAGHKM